MGQHLEGLTEQSLVEKIKRLDPEQVTEVLDFIEFLAGRKQKTSPLDRFLRQIPGSRVSLEEVRRRLAKVPGQMSDAVRALRDERG